MKFLAKQQRRKQVRCQVPLYNATNWDKLRAAASELAADILSSFTVESITKEIWMSFKVESNPPTCPTQDNQQQSQSPLDSWRDQEAHTQARPPLQALQEDRQRTHSGRSQEAERPGPETAPAVIMRYVDNLGTEKSTDQHNSGATSSPRKQTVWVCLRSRKQTSLSQMMLNRLSSSTGSSSLPSAPPPSTRLTSSRTSAGWTRTSATAASVTLSLYYYGPP